MINFKQIELGKMLFDELKKQFNEIEFVNITPSADNPDNLWVNMVMPEDDDRRIALGERAAEISADILEDYGYHIIIGSALPSEIRAA